MTELIKITSSGKISSTTKKVYLNQKYGTLLVPTKKGYKFLGWYTQSSGGDQITESSIVSVKLCFL